MKIKLVTDHPDNNTERLMNLAYIKDGEVWLRLEPDVKLCEYTAKACVGRGCEEATPEEWNELRKAREAGLFAAVCYNTEYAVNAMSNYCTDGLRECSSAAAVFRPRRPYSRADDLRFLL